VSGRSSRRKGKAGELEVVQVFRRAGLDVKRTPNSGGLSWPGDIIGLEGYVVEVKRCETLSVPAWLRQAYASAVGGEVPVVAFRRDGRGTGADGHWHAILPLDELARLIAGDRERIRRVSAFVASGFSHQPATDADVGTGSRRPRGTESDRRPAK
jgi:hypothetical protein